MKKTLKNLCLETSSYLPLIWVTPYSSGIIDLLIEYEDSRFFIQADCIREALSYVNYKRDWFRHPAIRFRHLAKTLPDDQIRKMSFPSSAFQILLGGKIWPSVKYLNFVRHTAFLYADLIDTVKFDNPRKTLMEIADKIDDRFFGLQSSMEEHLDKGYFEVSFDNLIPYWGIFYLATIPKKKWYVEVWDDPKPFREKSSKMRDTYHCKSILSSGIMFDLLIVANTNFERTVRENLQNFPVKIISAESRQNLFIK
jgi:hypothetical protein